MYMTGFSSLKVFSEMAPTNKMAKENVERAPHIVAALMHPESPAFTELHCMLFPTSCSHVSLHSLCAAMARI